MTLHQGQGCRTKHEHIYYYDMHKSTAMASFNAIRAALPIWVRLQQPQGQRYPVLRLMHAGSVRVSVIHRTLTWTAGSVTCRVRDHSDACVVCTRIVEDLYNVYV